LNSYKTIQALSLEVYEKLGKPINVRVVRAMLESMSIRDIDAKQEYEAEDLNGLSSTIFAQITSRQFLDENYKEEKLDKQFKSELTSVNDYLKLKTKYFLKYYPTGLFHGMPVYLQIATIIIFGYSLWTFSGFNSLQSTAVVLGVVFGLVCTGGFIQVIGRQLSHYCYCSDFKRAKESIVNVFRDAIIFMAIVTVGTLSVNFFANLYPYRFLGVLFAYGYSFGILLLFIAVFHPLKQRVLISIAFLMGLGVALLLHLYTDLNIYATHWIGIWTSIMIMLVYLVVYFRYKLRHAQAVSSATSKLSTLVFKNYRYFLYGMAFFIFIFTDRIMAWSTASDGNALPYIIYYEKNYEIGMDIAILIFFLLAGVLEYGIASFSTLNDQFQKLFSYDRIADFNKSMLKLYKEHVAILLISGLVITYVLYHVIWVNTGYEKAFNEGLDFVSIKVSILGGIGYILVAWGMLNSTYLFTLNKPTKPLNAILIALLVNAFVGALASRLISYEYSVIGFLAGSLVYMLITLKYTLKFFKDLDYYYYAAY